jgi:SAM-dependent methyltransferase
VGTASAGSGEWDRRQSTALPDYLRGQEEVTTENQQLYELFGWYLACAVLKGGTKKILDVGCGIGSRHPPYMQALESTLAANQVMYVGLDPLAENTSGRDYPFICGRIEDVPSVLDDRFDMFLFSSSLDHLEDTDRAAAAVQELAADRAVGVFWIGLHDADLVGGALGQKWFARLFSSLNPVLFFARAVAVAGVIARRYPDLVRRAWRLKTGVPLDNLHITYFTRSNVRSHLERFGELRDLTHIPGTNSVFATVAIRPKAGR